jgi:hypothetical protein
MPNLMGQSPEIFFYMNSQRSDISMKLVLTSSDPDVLSSPQADPNCGQPTQAYPPAPADGQPPVLVLSSSNTDISFLNQADPRFRLRDPCPLLVSS